MPQQPSSTDNNSSYVTMHKIDSQQTFQQIPPEDYPGSKSSKSRGNDSVPEKTSSRADNQAYGFSLESSQL